MHCVDLGESFQTHISCKISFRYSRERACQKFATICKKDVKFANFSARLDAGDLLREADDLVEGDVALAVLDRDLGR